MDKKTTMKDKLLTVLGTVLCVILVPVLVVNLTLIAKSYMNKDEVPSVGGYLPLIVLIAVSRADFSSAIAVVLVLILPSNSESLALKVPFKVEI